MKLSNFDWRKKDNDQTKKIMYVDVSEKRTPMDDRMFMGFCFDKGGPSEDGFDNCPHCTGKIEVIENE